MNEIQDIRINKDFKSITFSNFKKSDVKKELMLSLFNEKIEESCYWCAELVCAGHFKEIWDIIILFLSKYIHLGNVKLPIYLEMRYNQFKEIIVNGFIGNELRMRNNEKIRKLFCELMCVLCFSKKKGNINNDSKLTNKDFDFIHIQNKLKAPNTKYSDEIMLEEDPKELILSINELSYHISKDSNNTIFA